MSKVELRLSLLKRIKCSVLFSTDSTEITHKIALPGSLARGDRANAWVRRNGSWALIPTSLRHGNFSPLTQGGLAFSRNRSLAYAYRDTGLHRHRTDVVVPQAVTTFGVTETAGARTLEYSGVDTPKWA